MTLHSFSKFTANILEVFNSCLYCAAQPQTLASCKHFWGSLYLIGFLIAFIVFSKQLRKLWQDNKDMKAYLKKQEERLKVADDETMSKHIWHGEF